MLSAKELYDILVRAYGEPGWWSDDPYTVMFQSVLVQNTTWRSVERAYENIGRLSPDDVMSMPADELQKLVRPCGFCRRKSATIISLTEWFRDRASTGVLSEIPTGTLRDELMSIRGVGRETADVILVYALRRPVFVVDAYTRRLMGRLEYGFGDDRDIIGPGSGCRKARRDAQADPGAWNGPLRREAVLRRLPSPGLLRRRVPREPVVTHSIPTIFTPAVAAAWRMAPSE